MGIPDFDIKTSTEPFSVVENDRTEVQEAPGISRIKNVVWAAAHFDMHDA
jgi:hypothetical protein